MMQGTPTTGVPLVQDILLRRADHAQTLKAAIEEQVILALTKLGLQLKFVILHWLSAGAWILPLAAHLALTNRHMF